MTRFSAASGARFRWASGQSGALETRLNAIVYDVFALTPEERALIEATTKYPYREV